MANYFTSLAFKIAANHADAERFVQAIEAATALENCEKPMLAPEIEQAFRSDTQTAEEVFAGIIGDMGLGIDCLFNADDQSLIIFDNDGSPNLWALAQLLQRLYPPKLPLGFVYAETCDKSRAGGFGGGFFAISHDTIVNQSLAEVLEAEIAELGEAPDA